MIVAATGFRRDVVGCGAAVVLAPDGPGGPVRLQPWMYQFLLMGFAIAVCPDSQAITLCRIFLIALYSIRGCRSWIVAFVQGLGRHASCDRRGRLVGGTPAKMARRALASVAILLMPIAEILVAIGLVFPRTRRLAVLCGDPTRHATAHPGPLGLVHSTNVFRSGMSRSRERSCCLLGWTCAVPSKFRRPLPVLLAPLSLVR